MASTNKTDLLKLPQWQDTDKLEMTDLNDAFEKIDTKIAAHLAENATDDNGVHGLKYKKGTFTPSLRFTSGAGTITAINSASYIKINSLVYFTLYIQLDITVATGSIYITGFPYINKGGQTPITMAHQTLVDATDAIINRDNEINFFKNATTSVLASTGKKHAMLSGTYITD